MTQQQKDWNYELDHLEILKLTYNVNRTQFTKFRKKEQPEIEFEENQSLKGQQIQQTSTYIIKISKLWTNINTHTHTEVTQLKSAERRANNLQCKRTNKFPDQNHQQYNRNMK